MYQEIKDDILKIISPFNGKIIVDDSFVTQEVTPVVEELHKSLASDSFTK